MNCFFTLCSTTLFGSAPAVLQGSVSSSFAEMLCEIQTPAGKAIVYRPSSEEVRKTASVAKAIFTEAFSTTYTEYHRLSGSQEPIHQWLRLKPGLTLQSWLSLVFDEEYEESLAGGKQFLYLCDTQGALIGWLTHTPVSEAGEVYLSQCSLEADHRNLGIASAVFNKAFREKLVTQMFPNVKEIKLIVRKINAIAQHLYLKSGFTMDESIDPAVYGDSYDDRYVGFRWSLD